jgi:hypothetical protein
LEFPSVIFNAYAPSISVPIEKAQKRITRHICSKSGKFKSLPFPNYQERLKILHLESLEVRRLKFDLVTLHKVNNGLIKINPGLDTPPDIPVHNYNTRFRRSKAVIRRVRLLTRYNSFFVRVPKKYCKLPTSIQNTPDPQIFRKLDNYDLSTMLE